MALFTRRERPPAEIVAELDPDERVIAFADTSLDTVLVATSSGIWWPGPDGRRRIPWELVGKAVWAEGNIFTIIETEVVDDALLVDRPPVSARLTTPRDLPPAVKKRVEANIVRSELVSVGGGAVRFVARRRPGRDGLVWWARLEPGTPDTDTVRAAIRARIGLLQAGADGPDG